VPKSVVVVKSTCAVAMMTAILESAARAMRKFVTNASSVARDATLFFVRNAPIYRPVKNAKGSPANTCVKKCNRC